MNDDQNEHTAETLAGEKKTWVTPLVSDYEMGAETQGTINMGMDAGVYS